MLTILKLWVAVATGSLGLLAEAAHSALDFGAALLTWFAVRASWRPPDADHQYGHGKIENLSALAETLLLTVTACWILYEAASRMLVESAVVEPTFWAFLVMGVSIVVDSRRSRDLSRIARVSGSQALEADALHFSTDIASSAVVILGLGGVLAAERWGIEWLANADPIAALFVAGVVLVLSYRLGKRATDVLVDRVPGDVSDRVVEALRGIPGVVGPPRARVRLSGDRTFADAELSLQPGLPLAEGDRIARIARSRLRGVLGDDASVMIQLVARTDAEASLHDRVAVAVSMEGVRAHNITMREIEGGFQADLHLELPERLTLEQGHAIADRVEARVRSEVPEIERVDTHLELHGETAETATPLAPEQRTRLERRILEVAEEAGFASLHDLMLTRMADGVYLSCHCFFPSATSLAEAHTLTHRLEQAIRGAVPEITRVAVHAEPEGLHD